MTNRTARGARARLWALLAGIGVLLSACAEQAPQDTLEPEGPVARDIQNLFVPVFWIAVAVFVLVQGVLLVAAFRFRRRKGHEDDIPEQVHGNTRMEIGWTIAPAVILAVIAVPTIGRIIDLAEKPKNNPLEVTVYGQQWWWEYEYDNGAVAANELRIPTDRPVYLTMTSRDVIHSFWVPKLAGKKDVVPGRWHYLTIQADEPGEFYGQCVEFCGASHANMRLRVIAMEPADFDAWMADQTADAAEPAPGTLAAEGKALFQGRGCAGCHTIRGVNELPRDLEVLPTGREWAPDLTHVGSRGTFAGSLFELNPTELAQWLRNPPARKDGSLMPNLGLSQAEIEQLVAYLLSLK